MLPQVERESPTQTQSSFQSQEERTRLHALERVVERSLESFLECGRALLEVRDRRLYREHYKSFEHYLTRRWGITYSQGASLMRSTLVAENLLRGPAAPGGDAPFCGFESGRDAAAREIASATTGRVLAPGEPPNPKA